jgi:ADP-heptose:LPS heptosyltransferase
VLHCSAYAKAIGEWAMFNNLCTSLWVDGEEATPETKSCEIGLALYHCPQAVKAFKTAQIRNTFAPRTKLSTLWSYNHTVAQHRSRVEKSEMHYNIDMARALLTYFNKDIPEFKGLSTLKIPTEWKCSKKTPHTIIVVSNNASAANWSMDNYINYAKQIYDSTGRSVDFLVSGHDARFRKEALLKSDVIKSGMGLIEAFPKLEELIVYLSKAQLVVSSSTGPLHIAHAAGVNVFGLYPSKKVESFDRWRPDGYWHKSYVRYQTIL